MHGPAHFSNGIATDYEDAIFDCPATVLRLCFRIDSHGACFSLDSKGSVVGRAGFEPATVRFLYA